MLSKSVRLAAGQRVCLPPPFLVTVSTFLLVTVSALSPFFLCLRSCFPSCGSLCPSSLLFPFVSLLVGHCVPLVFLLFLFVSGLVPLVVGHCVRLVSFLFPFVFLLVGHCVRFVSLLFPLFPKQFAVGVLNSFSRCVRPLCHCWCPRFSAGHVAFLFMCLPFPLAM